MEYERIIVRLVDWLPPGASEFVVRTFDDGEYYFTIFLNQNASSERLIQAYDHALAHITAGDFDRDGDVQQIETVRHAS
jgi:hypothetical protein